MSLSPPEQGRLGELHADIQLVALFEANDSLTVIADHFEQALNIAMNCRIHITHPVFDSVEPLVQPLDSLLVQEDAKVHCDERSGNRNPDLHLAHNL